MLISLHHSLFHFLSSLTIYHTCTHVENTHKLACQQYQIQYVQFLIHLLLPVVGRLRSEVPIYTLWLCGHQLSLLISHARWKYDHSIDLSLIQTNVTADKLVATLIAK